MVAIEPRRQRIAETLGFVFPRGIINIDVSELKSPILQFLEQPDVSQRIIKPVVVQIHQRAARIQLVPVHTDTQTVELIESYLAIENLPKAGPDFVAVNPESTEQTVSQEDGCHRDERCWNADGEDIIGLAPHVFTDGKIHDEGAQYAGGYSDRQEYFGL